MRSCKLRAMITSTDLDISISVWMTLTLLEFHSQNSIEKMKLKIVLASVVNVGGTLFVCLFVLALQEYLDSVTCQC